MLLTVLAEQKSKKKINERYLKILLYIMMISLEISFCKIVGMNQLLFELFFYFDSFLAGNPSRGPHC